LRKTRKMIKKAKLRETKKVRINLARKVVVVKKEYKIIGKGGMNMLEMVQW